MIVLPRIQPGTTDAPGWWPFVHGRPMLRCKRGHEIAIHIEPNGFAIAPDGTVNVMVSCPVAGCDWCEAVRLADWPA